MYCAPNTCNSLVNSRNLSRGFQVTVLNILVVLGTLGDLALSQRWYEESLQMYGRLYGILMGTSSESENMATGGHQYMLEEAAVTVVEYCCIVCSVPFYGDLLHEFITVRCS